MNIKAVLSTILLATTANISLFSQTPFVTWNLGTIDAVWNHSKPIGDNSWDVQKMALSILDIQYFPFSERYGIQVSLIQYRKNQDISAMCTLLPTEIFVNMIDNPYFIVGFYGRGEINLYEKGFYPYAEGGIKIGTLVLHDPNKINYSWKCSLNIGYDSRNEINIGTQIDIGVFALFSLWASSQSKKEN